MTAATPRQGTVEGMLACELPSFFRSCWEGFGGRVRRGIHRNTIDLDDTEGPVLVLYTDQNPRTKEIDTVHVVFIPRGGSERIKLDPGTLYMLTFRTGPGTWSAILEGSNESLWQLHPLEAFAITIRR